MKNKTALMLMEQLVMVLVFALAAALCLQVFAKAEEVSARTACRDEAVLLAQNAAELLKAGEDPQVLAQDTDLVLQIEEKQETIPGLTVAEICVLYEGEILFTLTTGWQEVGP